MSTTGTIRQQIFDLLCRHTLDSRALSQQLSVAEKEVLTHLPHLAKSANSKGKRLVIHPANCRKCHFIFRDRSRFTKPGRCPRCKGTHLTPPLFSLR